MVDFLVIQTQTGWGQTLKMFCDWCQPEAGWLTLDVGCGPGLLPALFEEKGCRAFGLDRDPEALTQGQLHPNLAMGEATQAPFPDELFDLATASNLLFLLDRPGEALLEISRLIHPGGQVCLLNPSERISVSAAVDLAGKRGLQGAARASLLDWARRAEAHHRWTEEETGGQFAAAGFRLVETAMKIGPGLARLARGVK